MIDKKKVESVVKEWLEEDKKGYFLVDVEISDDARIVVEIDHAEGVWIDDCVSLSRFIEDHFSRDEEDYELEVGSAGIGQPFKVEQQYVNNIGKQVEVMSSGKGETKGKKIIGTLFLLTEETSQCLFRRSKSRRERNALFLLKSKRHSLWTT